MIMISVKEVYDTRRAGRSGRRAVRCQLFQAMSFAVRKLGRRRGNDYVGSYAILVQRGQRANTNSLCCGRMSSH